MISHKYYASMRSVWAGKGRKGRGLRILPKEGGYFVHVTSRCRGQAFLFGDDEKRSFVNRMRQWSAFSGIGVVTHCLMSNHFHMLLWVPGSTDPTHAEIVERLKCVWPEEKRLAWEALYASVSAHQKNMMDQALRERMGNLPAFMRVLKQSFANWYNHRHDCRGTLWEGRYRSVVVEETPLALLSVAAYIDLNPVRAGMAEDPMAAVWTGYGSACGGDPASRAGLMALVRAAKGITPSPALKIRLGKLQEQVHWSEISSVLNQEQQRRADPQDWPQAQAAYRLWLYAKGDAGPPGARNTRPDRSGIDPQQVLKTYEAQGYVPEAALLRRQWRCFSRGVGIGGSAFLETLLQQYRSCFGPNRKQAGSKIKNSVPGLQVLRQVD